MPEVAPTLRANGGKDSNGKAGNRNDQHPMVAVGPEAHTHTLTAEGYDASEDGTGRGTPLVAGALTKRYGKGINTTMDDGAMVNEAAGVRRLTPVECERLQGFPDGWTIPDDTPWQEHPKPDGPRYAQMGNAVTVPVAEWIGRRIMEYGE